MAAWCPTTAEREWTHGQTRRHGQRRARSHRIPPAQNRLPHHHSSPSRRRLFPADLAQPEPRYVHGGVAAARTGDAVGNHPARLFRVFIHLSGRRSPSVLAYYHCRPRPESLKPPLVHAGRRTRPRVAATKTRHWCSGCLSSSSQELAVRTGRLVVQRRPNSERPSAGRDTSSLSA